VHATCLGFETLAVIVSRNTSILSAFDGEDQPSTLQLAPGGNASRFWRSLPKRVQRNMQRKRYTMENHSNGGAPLFGAPEQPSRSPYMQAAGQRNHVAQGHHIHQQVYKKG